MRRLFCSNFYNPNDLNHLRLPRANCKAFKTETSREIDFKMKKNSIAFFVIGSIFMYSYFLGPWPSVSKATTKICSLTFLHCNVQIIE